VIDLRVQPSFFLAREGRTRRLLSSPAALPSRVTIDDTRYSAGALFSGGLTGLVGWTRTLTDLLVSHAQSASSLGGARLLQICRAICKICLPRQKKGTVSDKGTGYFPGRARVRDRPSVHAGIRSWTSGQDVVRCGLKPTRSAMAARPAVPQVPYRMYMYLYVPNGVDRS